METIYYKLNPWWQKKEFEAGIERKRYLEALIPLFNRRQINVIIGSRRIGKTTILKQLIKNLLEKNGVKAEEILYLELDHPQLVKTPVSEHLKKFRKQFMHSSDKKLFLFLDEIQESPDWERELKSIYDVENVKMVCTGSTSSLIKSQGGKLTGRQIVTPIYPLTFGEFLSFRNVSLDMREDYKYERMVEEYLNIGGYPENVLSPSDDYLNNLVESIIARDMVRLYHIKKPYILKDLLKLIASSVGTRISYSKLGRVLSTDPDTIKEYIEYFRSAFLVEILEKWTTSYNEKVYASKKIYLMDTGIKTLLTGTEDIGFKSENVVFLQLLREKAEDIGYYVEGQKEIDFVVGRYKTPQIVEVKYVSNLEWQDKRLQGVKLFLRKHPNIKSLTIVTRDTQKRFKEDKIDVQMIPLWKMLLS